MIYPDNVPEQYQMTNQDFVGRQFVFAEIDRFMQKHSNGYFTIIGEPGIGKSAFIAEYVRRTNCLAHFNSRPQGITSINYCLRNILEQATKKYQIPPNEFPEFQSNYTHFWEPFLNQLSKINNGKERIVIAIDALDEVVESAQPPSANVLLLPPYLPDNVYFIVTTRNVQLPFVVGAPHAVLNLDDYREQTLSDIKEYIQRSVVREPIRKWLRERSISAESFVETIAEKCGNHFLYLRYILAEIEHGEYAHTNLSDLPMGLEGYYRDHWRKMGMGQSHLQSSKLKIIYTLASIQEPISVQLISAFSGESQSFVKSVLDEWAPFLHEGIAGSTRQYSWYHQSFKDFLLEKDIVQSAGISQQAINAHIAEHLWNELFSKGS
jgi:hypothetical protein